ncbi:polysaccharide biosynthesis tyrosine autokinase [Thiomicrorhabdus sp. 6S2-11]|uniref:non-specific protein-tyrosine kinase n=1 Tax=Thiomicrorhabdus marina TaxID=2818442 RepID=A0ABS3Q254_9GAMM|nr:polysaccharide biosynthesis tyrosine autokinase [Thiomicrorhabdus marina]MBO1926356.1 polysaccharide biosynthesis tyrosine autokinase [Thiomicrorhabdus marina]
MSYQSNHGRQSVSNANSESFQNNFSSSEQANNDVIDLLPIFKYLWARRWSIVSFTGLAVVLAVLIVSQMEPVYKATTSLQISSKEAQVVSVEELYGIDNSDEYLNTQFELIKSRTVAERVVQELNLVNHREFDPAQKPEPLFNWRSFVLNWLVSDEVMNNSSLMESEDVSLSNGFGLWKDQILIDIAGAPEALTESEVFERVVSAFMKRVSVTPVKKSQLVNISVEMADPHTAALAANKIAESYINTKLEASIAASTEATGWMNQRLAELKVKLSKAEEALQAFKKEKGLIDLDGIVTVSANELSELNRKLVTAKAERAEAESQYIQVRDTKPQGWEALASIPAVLSHPVIQTFIAEEAKAQAKVAELSERYGSRHPSMKAAQKELESAQAGLKLKVEQIVAGIEKKYQIARANEKALAGAVWSNKSQIKKVASNEFELTQLKREVESNQALYNTFLTRIKETNATSDMQLDVTATIVDKALKPLEPIKPKKKLIVVLAAILAMLLIVTLFIVLKALNNTFKTSREVESKLNLSVLGVLPLVKVKKAFSEDLVELYHKNEDRSYIESVNTLRTSVMLTSLKHDYKKIMVTSSIPGEGKTTTSTNLAFAISNMEKTLLIEADMRRPNLAKKLRIGVGVAGLANVLSGVSELEEAIYTVDNLDVLPAGNVPPNPLELLMNNRFTELLASLEQKYERIIIDTPPVNAVSDALVLAGTVDKVVYVIKGDATPVDTVVKGVGQLLQNNAPLKGVVLNQVNIKKAQKEGYYHEGYYDYYGYNK